ncbi:hypothetical protein C8R41DRAFT_29180 [Lentinula lateritia]|uniref:BRCT domain-containing protein n=1 Tax=Lentinula lateritia TaxID=40482 RepID=A0ABQ8VT77_9AGAR|nr:hypothetical protein C8R41DRAFT_29180 [Lentinula lateritia]
MDASVTEEPVLNIFVDSSGIPLRIFVEDSPLGPTLVNRLKIHGARITPTIQNAQYIIIESNSFSGHHYERNLEGKILDSSWIGKCIRARRILLEDDDWGGCAVANTAQGEQAPPDSQYLPPRLMRRPDPRSGALSAPDIPSTFQFNPTAGVIPFLPQSHTSSNTPTSSRGTTAEPAFIARQQQDGQSPHPHTPQITPSPNFQAPSFMQTGAMMPSAFSLNPHLLQMVPNQFQDQNFFMALADVYRANMMNLAALSQFHQPQQPSYSFPEAPPDTTPAPVPAPASSKAKSTESHSGSSMASSSLPSKELSRNDKGKQKASPAPSSSSTRSFSEPQIPIFTRNGKSVMFFVQIDLSQRHDLVNQIKKNGGAISNELDKADYAILSSRSKIFATLFRTSTASGTPAVISSFVHDCIRKGRVLSHDPKYLVEAPRRQGRPPSDDVGSSKKLKADDVRKGRASHDDIGPSKKRKVEVARKEKVLQDTPYAKKKLKAEAEPRATAFQDIRSAKKSKAEVERVISSNEREQVKKREISAVDKILESKQRIPSPPPPPESTRVFSNNGGYAYPPLEREYVETYAKVLFERDHLISNAKIAQKLYQKMPHHTAKSWNTTVGGQLREVIDKARKRAGIAYRKNAYNETLGLQQPSTEDGDQFAKRQKLSGSDSNDRDIEFIAQFFAEGEANDVEDQDDNRAALWERLHARAKWRTASSWEEFYEENHLEVKRHFGEITGQETE